MGLWQWLSRFMDAWEGTTTMNRLDCVHCDYPLERAKGDGKEVCRFCIKQFRPRCIYCRTGRLHEKPA